MQDKASGKRPAVFERLAFSLNEQCLQFIIAHCKYNNVYRDKRLFKSCFLRILNHSVGRTTRYLNVLRKKITLIVRQAIVLRAYALLHQARVLFLDWAL